MSKTVPFNNTQKKTFSPFVYFRKIRNSIATVYSCDISNNCIAVSNNKNKRLVTRKRSDRYRQYCNKELYKSLFRSQLRSIATLCELFEKVFVENFFAEATRAYHQSKILLTIIENYDCHPLNPFSRYFTALPQSKSITRNKENLHYIHSFLSK